MYSCLFIRFFFVKQKTAYEMRISDWSSDVCSSDLQDILECNIDDTGAGPDERVFLKHPDQADIAVAQRFAIAIQDITDHIGYVDRHARRIDHVRRIVKIGRASCRERVCQ